MRRLAGSALGVHTTNFKGRRWPSLVLTAAARGAHVSAFCRILLVAHGKGNSLLCVDIFVVFFFSPHTANFMVCRVTLLYCVLSLSYTARAYLPCARYNTHGKLWVSDSEARIYIAHIFHFVLIFFAFSKQLTRRFYISSNKDFKLAQNQLTIPRRD